VKTPITTFNKLNLNTATSLLPGLSRATAGPGETFLCSPQTLQRSLSAKRICYFSFQNDAFWCTLYFWV